VLEGQKLARAAGRAVRYPLAGIWRNWSLIRSMVGRDIRGRYRGSFGGMFWTVLNPLLLMITYFFVFGIVLRARFGNDPSRAGFVLYFLAGMLPWLAFSEAAGRAPFVMLEHRNFVKKLVFPLEILPVNLVLAGLVTEVIALVIFGAGLLGARGAVPVTVLWLPLLLVPQVLFTAGLSWFLAALGVYVRDLGQVNGFLLTLWFFLTPICYPVEALPREALPALAENPMFILVAGYRAIFLEHQPPAWGPLWKLWLVALAVFFLGHAFFYKLKKSFADVI
jgi:lipopolysaccharide transport system permease protein